MRERSGCLFSGLGLRLEGVVEQQAQHLSAGRREAIDLEADDLEAVMDELAIANPGWADFLKDAAMMKNFVFWAGAADRAESDFLDSLNIQRFARGAGDDASILDEVVSMWGADYGDYGFEVTDSATGLTVAGVPAGYIQYTASATMPD